VQKVHTGSGGTLPVPFSWYQGPSPAGILKSEITSWNLPYVLIIALLLLLLMRIIIILGMHSYAIFLK